MSNVQENKIRDSWRVKSKVSIYSASRKKWFTGHVQRTFVDDCGEWLEVRYNNGKTVKQLQRFSEDIRPLPPSSRAEEERDSSATALNNQNPDPQGDGMYFTEEEFFTRNAWKRRDQVQIYSNSSMQWYEGEIRDILNDDEGEWLVVVWGRNNNCNMVKQVQRFSTDIRAHPTKSSDGDKVTVGCHLGRTAQAHHHKKRCLSTGNERKTKKKYQKTPFVRGNASGFRRLFNSCCSPSTNTFPATMRFRQLKSMDDIVEEDMAKVGAVDVCERWVRDLVVEDYVPEITKVVDMFVVGPRKKPIEINIEEELAQPPRLMRLDLSLDMSFLDEEEDNA